MTSSNVTITLHIAFSLNESDSLKVLSSENNSASHLSKRSETIINDNNAEKEVNVVLQAANNDRMQQNDAFCPDPWEEYVGVKPKMFINDGSGRSDLAKNDDFLQGLAHRNVNKFVVYVGAPMFMRDKHENVIFHRYHGSNLLVCGTDRRAAVSTLALINYQIAKMLQIDTSDYIDNMMMADYFVGGAPEASYLREFARRAHIKYLPRKEVAAAIDIVYNMLKERIEQDMNGIEFEPTPYFISILYFQNALEFRKDKLNRFPQVSSQLQFILQNGPDYGIYVMVYSDTYKGLTEVLGGSFLWEDVCFHNRLMLCGGATDKLIEHEVDKLSTGCALLETADNSTTYVRDPVLIYNQNSRDYEADDTLKHIFSIYSHQTNGDR